MSRNSTSRLEYPTGKKCDEHAIPMSAGRITSASMAGGLPTVNGVRSKQRVGAREPMDSGPFQREVIGAGDGSGRRKGLEVAVNASASKNQRLGMGGAALLDRAARALASDDGQRRRLGSAFSALGIHGSFADRIAGKLLASSDTARAESGRRRRRDPAVKADTSHSARRSDGYYPGMNSSAFERFRSGTVDIEVPSGFNPIDENGDAFRWMVFPYLEDDQVSLERSEIDRIFDAPKSDVARRRASYRGWDDEDGRTINFLRHVLNLLWVYRDYFPTEWPPDAAGYADTTTTTWSRACRHLPDLMEDLYFGDGSRRRVRIVRKWRPQKGVDHTSDLDDNRVASYLTFSTVDGTTRVRFSAGSINFRAQQPGGNRPGGHIEMTPPFLASHAEVADFFLGWGNRAYWYAMRKAAAGELLEAIRLLNMSFRCGRVALAAMFDVARTIGHEAAHVYFDEDPQISSTERDVRGIGREYHCPQACCMNGLAFFWWARARARHGAPYIAAGTTAPTDYVDTAMVINTDTYTSLCLDDPNVDGDEVAFVGSASFPFAGAGGDCLVAGRDDWTWTNGGNPGSPAGLGPIPAFPGPCAPRPRPNF